MDRFGLFVSYRPIDSDRGRPLVEALERLGLRFRLDQQALDDFAPLTDAIRNGLAASKALLAWNSIDYPRSRSCPTELTTAFLAAGKEGDPRCRMIRHRPVNESAIE